MKRGQPLRRRRKGPDARLTYELDTAVSLLIRSKGYCERCGKRKDPAALQCAHIYGRANYRLRWEPRNLMSLCAFCHRQWHSHPLDAAEWLESHRPADVAWLRSVANEITRWTPSQKKEKLLELRELLANELDEAA